MINLIFLIDIFLLKITFPKEVRNLEINQVQKRERFRLRLFIYFNCMHIIQNSIQLEFEKHMTDFDQTNSFNFSKGQPIVDGKYKVIGKLGYGAFATVYAISLIKSKKTIVRAIKLEKLDAKEPQINSEVTVLNKIKECNEDQIGFCKIYEYGAEEDYNYMVMDMLGPNLQQLMKLCGGSFSLKTTLLVSLQIIDRIQKIHNQGFVYGDIRPDNFLVGVGSQSSLIHMIDFGNCKRFKNKGTNQHIMYKQNVVYSFNSTFASINAHNHIQISRRDDIQSLLYLMIFMRMAKLPWMKQSENKRVKVSESFMEETKKRITPESLCLKMPIEFIDLAYYIKSIEFYERPDYNHIRKTLYRVLERLNIQMDITYDWNLIQEVDFKLYNGQPKIIFVADHNEEQEDIIVQHNENGSKIEEDNSQQDLIANLL